METGDILPILVIAEIINFIIFYFIIKSATKSTSIEIESIKQSILLAAIAKKERVDPALIGNILKLKDKGDLRIFSNNNKI